jgi:hypothetical protein
MDRESTIRTDRRDSALDYSGLMRRVDAIRQDLLIGKIVAEIVRSPAHKQLEYGIGKRAEKH